MRELTAKDSAQRIFLDRDRLFYIQKDLIIIVCTRCAGALATHSFCAPREVRFPFVQQCHCKGD